MKFEAGEWFGGTVDGLILAAGCGSRLGTRSPKCLAHVGGRSLLQIQLDRLRQAGAEDITIVVGYRQEEIRAAALGQASFVVNPRFAETNSLYSFYLARSRVTADLLVLNSDVLFPMDLLRHVLDAGGSALAFDSGSGEDEEHMKVSLSGGRLVTMSKDLPRDLTDGENVGLLHLRAATAAATFDAAASLVRQGQDRSWLARAVSEVAGTHPIAGVDIAGLPWVEIDYPDDLAVARAETWPAIKSLELFAERSRRSGALWSSPDTEEAVAG